MLYVLPCLPAGWVEIARHPSLLIAGLRLAGVGSRYHSKGNTLRQQQQQLADILVQVPPNKYVACCRVGGSRGGGGRVLAVLLVRIRLRAQFCRQRSFFLYL